MSTQNSHKLIVVPDQAVNLARQYLRDRNETIKDYDSVCGELANAIIKDDDSTLWVEGDIPWKYHMVALIGGLVHDAWCEGDALPPRDWLIKMFGSHAWVEVSLNGDIIFEGTCGEFEVSQ